MCDQCDGGLDFFDEASVTEEELVISEILLDCEIRRGCEMARRIIAEAVFDDGIIYTGGWGRKRAAAKFAKTLSQNGIEPATICESGICALNFLQKDVEY